MMPRQFTEEDRKLTASIRVDDALCGLELVGYGSRSLIYRASYRGETVALKIYRPAAIRKYQRRYGINIAAFEFRRNQAFYADLELRRFSARPIRVFGLADGYDLAFLQEFVDGVPLKTLARRLGGIPGETLEMGQRIVRLANAAGLYDLDIHAGNVMVRAVEGQWSPVLYDFNLVPQHIHAPNPFAAIAYRLGIRSLSHRDYRSLDDWTRLGVLGS